MSEFIKLKSLKEIEDKYDIFFIDLWGVIHNGLQLFESIENVLNRLKHQGNTVVVIEHNLDVIKTADWIIDLGPEGGSVGGRIVAEGTPEEVSKLK